MQPRTLFRFVTACVLMFTTLAGSSAGIVQASSFQTVHTAVQQQSPFAWTMKATFQAPASESSLQNMLNNEIADRIADLGVQAASPRVSQSTGIAQQTIAVDLSGSEGLEQLRSVLYGGASKVFSPIAEPTNLTLHGNVAEGEQFSIQLEANLTTGYSWQVQPSTQLVSQVGTAKLSSDSYRLGAPMHQEITFQAAQAGEAVIQLEYRRPFEPAVEASRTLDLQVAELSMLADLTDPIVYPEMKPLDAAEVVGEPLESAIPMPSSFSWGSQGKLPPIRDQQSCGSCWAFGTVGPLESAIIIRDGVTRDLSEQYLVSCSTSDYGCQGGGTAHDYHMNKVPSGEPQAGAVLESNFPYTAKDAGTGTPCNPPHTHSYRISSWQWVTFSSPNTDAIKNAIYFHGPVKASVCAGDAFQSYQAGTVMTTDESYECSGGTNHAIVLVGWDDTKGANGAWLLRNSWNTWWGENGYMWIGYGVSGVGKYTSYVVYNAPAIPALISPANGGSAANNTTFDWSDSSGAINYEIQIDDSSSFSSPEVDTFTGNAASQYTVASQLAAGVNYWRVRASAAAGNWSEWSSYWSVLFSGGSNPVPVITNLYPAYKVVGSGPSVMEISGVGILPTSMVYWNGVQRSATYSSSTQRLQITVNASDLTTPGIAEITVTNPAPGGGTSQARHFTIQSGVPNDDFANAIPVNRNPFDHAEGIFNATKGIDDPVLPESCMPVGDHSQNSVWYAFTAPWTGALTAKTLNSNYDTVLSIWSGSRGSLTMHACQDDTADSLQSDVHISAVKGTTYYILVSSYDPADSSEESLVLDVDFGRLTLPMVIR